MTIGLRITIRNLLEALVNERAISIEWPSENTIIATLENIQDSNIRHQITGQCQKKTFSNEVENFDWESIRIDNRSVEKISDLMILGLNDRQLSLLEENVEATNYLEAIYEKSRTERPKILKSIANLIGSSFPLDFDPKRPKAYAMLLAQLPGREALIVTETCGNIDGSTGNPIKNVMFGQKSSAIKYHPIVAAFQHETSQIQLVTHTNATMLEAGFIPARLLHRFKFYIDQHQIPMNKYAVDVSCKQSNVEDSIDAFVLLSKRSFMPLDNDFQIKTSFPAQITSESRIIDWSTAEDAIECARIVSQLASLRKLPDNLWILPTLFAAQVKDDDNTTFYIRGGLCDAYSNGTLIGIPEHLTPITACALTARNIITPDKTLFESLVEFGFHPMDLFRDISDSIIGAQLHFIAIRWIPDAHTQNVAYLLDMQEKRFAGLLLKDSECEKNKIIRGGKLASLIFATVPPAVSQETLKQRVIISTLYFHHTIFTKHIEPLAQILNDKYHISIADIQAITHHSLKSWLENDMDSDIQQKIDLTGGYYERNLASKTLKIGESPHYRIIKNHKLIIPIS